MKPVHILYLALFLAACGTKTAVTPVEDTAALDSAAADGTLTDTSSIPAANTPKQADSKIFKGFYISGNEVSTFRECGDKQVRFWVEDQSGKLAASYKKASGFLSYPYESIYVELKGYLKGKSTVGYAEEYENVLVVTEVTSAVQKSFHSDCFAYEFIGIGNEPFWSVDIIPAEKIIAVKDVAAEKTYVFPYQQPQENGSTFIYATVNGQQQKLKAVFKKEPCGDGMSDRKYDYAVELTLNGKTLKGCAVKAPGTVN